MKENRLCYYDHLPLFQDRVGEKTHANYSRTTYGDDAGEKSEPRDAGPTGPVSLGSMSHSMQLNGPKAAAKNFLVPSTLNPQPREAPTNRADCVQQNSINLTTHCSRHLLHKLLGDQVTNHKCTASYEPLEPSNGILAPKALTLLYSFISDSSVLKTWGNPLSLSNLSLAHKSRTVSSAARQQQFLLSSPEPKLLKALDLSVRKQSTKCPAQDYLMGSSRHKTKLATTSTPPAFTII